MSHLYIYNTKEQSIASRLTLEFLIWGHKTYFILLKVDNKWNLNLWIWRMEMSWDSGNAFVNFHAFWWEKCSLFEKGYCEKKYGLIKDVITDFVGNGIFVSLYFCIQSLWLSRLLFWMIGFLPFVCICENLILYKYISCVVFFNFYFNYSSFTK